MKGLNGIFLSAKITEEHKCYWTSVGLQLIRHVWKSLLSVYMGLKSSA